MHFSVFCFPTAGLEESVIRNIKDYSLKRPHRERKPKQETEENTSNSSKTSFIKMRQEKPILDRKVELSIDNRQSFQKENRTQKQSKLANSVPPVISVTHPRSHIDSLYGTQRYNSLGFDTVTNKVVPFSNEFSTVERDVDRFIADLDSKTNVNNCTEFQRKQQSSQGKVLQFKLNDSMLLSSSDGKKTLSNRNSFVDAITVQIKVNEEQLMNEFVNRTMMKPQQPQEESTTLKAEKETPLTRNEHYDMPGRLKKLALERLNQQRNEKLVPFRFEKQDISHDVRKETNSFGREFTQNRRIATQRWITDLLKGVGSLETGGLTDNDQDKVRHRGRDILHRSKPNSLAVSPNRALHEASIRSGLPLMRKQNISKPKTWQTPKMTLSHSAENEYSKEDNRETECSASCSSKCQQRKAERDVRIALWQAKNGCLGGTLKKRNMQDGLVDKVRDALI